MIVRRRRYYIDCAPSLEIPSSDACGVVTFLILLLLCAIVIVGALHLFFLQYFAAGMACGLFIGSKVGRLFVLTRFGGLSDLILLSTLCEGLQCAVL